MPDEVDIRFKVDDHELDNTAKKVDQFGPAANKSFQQAHEGGGFGGLMSKVSNLGFAVFGLQQTFGAVGSIFGGMFSGNIQFEQFEQQFATLFKGDTDKAKERMKELATFAKDTPFELPEVVQASKILETFGGSALSTGKGLTLLGDVASGTGVPIQELATHWGRLYDGLKNGRPVGEAMQRLQEIGAISGETRNKIEDMQKAGVNGDVVWATLTDSMDKYAGGMERQSKTMGGAISNIQDGIGALKRNLMQGLFDAAKGPIMSLANWLGSEGVQGAALKAGTAIGTVLGGALKGLITLVGMAIEPVSDLVGWLGPKLSGPIGDIVESFASLGTTIDDLRTNGLASFGDDMAEGFRPMLEMLGLSNEQISAFGAVWQKAGEMVAAAIGEMDMENFAAMMDSVAESAKPMLDVLRPLAEDVLKELNKQVSAVIKALTDAAGDLAGMDVDWKELATAIGAVATVLGAAFLLQLKLVIEMVGTALVTSIKLAVIAIETFLKVVGGIITIFKGLIDFFAGVFTGDWDRAWKGIGEIVDGIVTVIKATISGFFESAKTLVLAQLGAIKEQFFTIFSAIDELTGGKLSDIKNAITGFLGDVKDKLTGAIGTLKGAAEDLFNAVVKAIVGILKAMVDNDMVKWIKDLGMSIFNGIAEVVANAVLLGKGIMQGVFDGVGRIEGIGEDIVKGIWNGISSMGGWLWEKVQSFIKKNVKDAVEDFLHIGSPSKLMAEDVGVPIVTGMMAGIDSQSGALQGTVKRIVDGALGVATAGVAQVQQVLQAGGGWNGGGGASVATATAGGGGGGWNGGGGGGASSGGGWSGGGSTWGNNAVVSGSDDPNGWNSWNQANAPWWQGSIPGTTSPANLGGIQVAIDTIQVNTPADVQTVVNGISYGVIQELHAAGLG